MLLRSLLLGVALVAGSTPTTAADEATRPPITGISHLAVYAGDLAASDRFYRHVLGAEKTADPEDPRGFRYRLGGRQFVEVLPLPSGHGPGRLAHVAYDTTDAAALRRYLLAYGARSTTAIVAGPDGERWFGMQDPEGNEVRFVQPAAAADPAVPGAISGRIIHVGHLVRDRHLQDRFYRDLLGFRPYWFGAMKEGAVDWISQQVPDGRDWLEYMMVGPGSTSPSGRVDADQLGVLNHVSLGVPNMEAAVTRLIAEDRMSPRHDGPNMGRDGKWQTNLYDPDGTRIELMEFRPVTKPCCSPFTAESPTG